MISVYALVIKEKTGERQLIGVWRGGENTAPEHCLTMETRNGDIITHYWIMDVDERPNKTTKCLCGKERYKEE